MKPLRLCLPALFLASFAAAQSQSPNIYCVASATPPLVRAEGLTERIGGIALNCTGQPNATSSLNLSVTLNANITNRVSSGNTLSGLIFTIDSGSGPQAVTVAPTMNGPNSLAYNGVSLALSSSGAATLLIDDIRANATQAGLNAPLAAFIGVNGASLLLTSATLTVGTPQRSLYSSQSQELVCTQTGAALPSTISFSSLISSGAIFASTRVTEGFADAFQPRGGWANLNADTGTRIIVRYSGFPPGAQLFVPDVVAGSDAAQPTAGGDFGVPASGGAYAPSAAGSLLLARVAGADSNGAGGTPGYAPGLSGSAAVQFDKVSQLPIANSAAYAVYEVVDADPNRVESAQFPTFLGLAPSSVAASVVTGENVSLAPVSTVSIATAGDPIPRFFALTPLPDCSIAGDCNASYLPRLSVQNTPFQYAAAGGAFAVNYLYIHNTGSGVMQWTVTASYPPGAPAGWLVLTPSQGVDNATVRVDANAASLQPGNYTATLTVDGGPLAGSQTIPVSFSVGAAPPPPAPRVQVSSVVNAASFANVPVVPGSLSSIMGSAFSGKSVSVTFDSQPAQVLFGNNTQINVIVPPGLSGATAKLIVSVDGASSAPDTVNVAPFAPAIFRGGVLNQDWTANGMNNPAAGGSIVQIYATGLSGNGPITARIGDRVVAAPYYAGPAPGFPGVQQIDVQIPSGLGGTTADVFVCGAAVCSAGAPLTVK